MHTFGGEMVRAQKKAVEKDWEGFKDIMRDNKELLFKPFDLFENSPIQAVARAGNENLLRELLQMLPETEQLMRALRWKNHEENTLLHEVVLLDDPKMVDIIMNEFDNEELPSPLDELNDAKETPPFRAAKYGKLLVLKHLLDKHQLHSKHFPVAVDFRGNKRPILHTCVLTFNFDVAVWLLEKVDKGFAKEKFRKSNEEESKGKENEEESKRKNNEGEICLKIISKMPEAFKSTGILKMGVTKRIIYALLPEYGYESESELEEDDDNAEENSVQGSSTDVESSQPNDGNEKKTKPEVPGFLSRVNNGFWKFAKGFTSIRKIWDEKKKHKFAHRLVKLLLDNESSWKECPFVPANEPIQISPDYPSNVTEKKEHIELKERVRKEEAEKELLRNEDKKMKKGDEHDKTQRNEDKKMKKGDEDDKTKAMWETPLFLAAASGIIEIVQLIVDEYPEAISYVNSEGLNILHVAVKHRKLDIYEYIEKSPAFESLKPRISKNKRTILHQAASMEYYREESLSGVAYQLQRELEWYDRVREIVPPQYLLHVDEDGLTAGDLLDIDHAEMHDQAKVWMKETAQSCSTVAVLIAGVVFAAAYAIPGGTDKGTPIMHSSSAFRVFTIMDVVALATSLGSVVMFLSILTSSFDLWDFHISLPRKLKWGFIMLFSALITTMLAFAATILLTIRMEGNKKSTTLAYSLAFVIVSLFGLTQFPLDKLLEGEVKRCLKFWKTLKKWC